MKLIKGFVKRNSPIVFFGLLIVVIFLAIILFEPNKRRDIPSGFKKVEEDIFVERESKEPEKPLAKTEPVPQIANPENKGKPYFYGEYDPSLRDDQGYPIPPSIGSVILPNSLTEDEKIIWRQLETEVYQKRLKPANIIFTDKGFSPPDTSVCTGREVTWTNKSAKDIKIVETTPKHEALKNGAVIQPNGSFSFRPLKDGLFSYVEDYSKKYGTIMVSDVTKPLINGLNEE